MKLHWRTGATLAAAAVALTTGALAGTYEAPQEVRTAGEVKFAAQPRAEAAGDQVKITFTVSAPTDVEVAVLGADGKVVRHLVAGLLGKNAPEPFKKDSLAQEVFWDRKDDAGKPTSGGPFKVRVRAGSTPRLDKYAGWNGNTFGWNIAGLAVGKAGELYVLDGEVGSPQTGFSTMRVFDRDGKYLRTTMPYPANTPKERVASVGQLDIEGERLPIVFNAHGGNLAPMTCGMMKQNMAYSPLGHLVLFSAVGTATEHGPPRHLLAMAPDGGAPDGMSFVGPQVRKAKGFMGGAGEKGIGSFDHVAMSPDGKWIYVSTYAAPGWAMPKTEPAPKAGLRQRYGVYRVRWGDRDLGAPFLGKEAIGSDDEHFNNPHGLATDKAGNIYVCDSDNNRVMIFSAEGKLLGKFAVEAPEQIAVHPGSGEIYLVSRKAEKNAPGRLLKFSPWGKGEPKELVRNETANVILMAVDPESSPARLWVTANMGWGKPQLLAPVTDKGSQLELGPGVGDPGGLGYPLWLAADPARNRVLLRECYAGIVQLDLTSGRIASLPLRGICDVAVDRGGNIYGLHGYGGKLLSRFDPNGKPLPFAAANSNGLEIGPTGGRGPNMGLRGHCVAPNGDIYVLRSMGASVVDVFGPDGSVRKRALVNGLDGGASGLGVDAAGNVYVGVNAKPGDKPYPAPFMGKVPASGWVWWRGQPREGPWQYPYYNAYLFHWGAAFKFGPGGGAFHGLCESDPKNPEPLAAVGGAPAEAVAYKSGYLNKDVKAAGALWRYPGCGVVPATGINWGDPACCCIASHLTADEYGRVFVPNAFRFSVEMLDTAGNQIARIGRYGNADSAGPGSRVPEPEIAFAWPLAVSVADGRIYTCDTVNRRVAVVRLDWAASAECPPP